MNLQQLRYFVTAAQTLNFTEAAKRHYLTQPAVSRQITELENELNLKLFIRSSHKVILTDAGEEFYNYARDMLDMSDKAVSRMRTISQGQSGILKISSIPCPTPGLVNALSLFSKQYPAIQVDLDVVTGQKQILSIQKNECDIYFSFKTLLQSQDSLSYITTDEERCCLLIREQDAPKIDIHDFSSLKGKNLICEYHTEGPFLHEKISEICINRGLDIKDHLPMTNIFAVAIAVAAGIGFTIMPETLAKGTYTEHLANLPIPGDDALVKNAVGWNRLKYNSAKEKFLQVLLGLYPDNVVPIF